ncbi:MAG: tRNA(adenine34) deaminase [Actinomycetota bacterium]|jgi:tRNA(Arg) A34 adenosine deaminase TadA|nr:tRNA(adenine34) deaminase [Actinomycetota bacterium]
MALRTTSEARNHWADLDGAWRAVLQLAWEAYRAGGEPVGAVVVRPEGSILAKGRNHVFEHRRGPGALPGGPLAHAAVVALSALDPFERHDDFTLVVSIEPCLLCIGATVAAAVGAIRYAAADFYAGAASALPSNPETDRLELKIDGPLEGPFGLMAGALRLEPFVRLNPEGHVVRWAAERDPAALRLAQVWATRGTLQTAADERTSLSELIPSIWKSLAAAAGG